MQHSQMVKIAKHALNRTEHINFIRSRSVQTCEDTDILHIYNDMMDIKAQRTDAYIL